MWGKRYGSNKLCPVSFGLALGITAALAALLMAAWAMYYGVPPEFAAMHKNVPTITWKLTGWFMLWSFIKGFLFGFVLVLFYDLFACCCRMSCCKSSGCNCCKTCGGEGKCGCSCHQTDMTKNP